MRGPLAESLRLRTIVERKSHWFLADFLHSISGPIVLVGHSYGGAVITNAATGDSQVNALVYVDAFAPAQGQTLAQLLASVPGSCAVRSAPPTTPSRQHCRLPWPGTRTPTPPK